MFVICCLVELEDGYCCVFSRQWQLFRGTSSSQCIYQSMQT